VDGHTYKVPVGACSPLIKLPPGKVAVTELRRHGSQLVGVATQPTGRLISVNLPTRTALVKVVPGGIARQTIVTFTNKETATGTLKICKVAGHGVRVGTKFTFNVGTQMVTVPAGPGPAGYCKVVGAFQHEWPPSHRHHRLTYGSTEIGGSQHRNGEGADPQGGHRGHVYKRRHLDLWQQNIQAVGVAVDKSRTRRTSMWLPPAAMA
jgi:hypothetical protein